MTQIKVPSSPVVRRYFERIQKEAERQYEFAKEAKATGVDVSCEVEMTPALDMADRAETLIGLPGLARRYREVSLEIPDRQKAYFHLFKEIIEQKWCNIPDDQKRIEIAKLLNAYFFK